MPKNSLAKRAVTNFAVKATPSILAHVIGNTLGGGELSKVTNSICNTIKTVTCKDRIVMEEAIKTQALLDEKVCDHFLSILYDSVQVYVQSDCKDYSRIVEWLIRTPNATPEEKVKYAKELKQQQHEHQLQILKAVGNQVSKVIAVIAMSGIGNKVAGQAPLIIEKLDKANNRHARIKLEEIRKKAEVDKAKAKYQAKNK